MVKDCRMTPDADVMKERIVKEAVWLGVLALIGLVLLPIAIYLVGRTVFGEYGGDGFGGFYGELLSGFVSGEPVVWFLLLSPYLLWLLFRVTVWGFRRLGRSEPPAV